MKILNKLPVMHPLLFALSPILALYVYSSRAIPTTVEDIAIPIGLAVACSVIIYLILNILIKNAHKAALLDSILIIGFFSYGHVTSRLKHWLIGIGDQLFFILCLVLITTIFIFVIKSKRDYSHVTAFLNIMGIFLVVFNLAAVSRLLLKTNRFDFSSQTYDSSKPAHLPNIYFILLDAYARADVLSEVYGIDNSDFVDYLEQKGFYIATQSPANYCHTELALAAALNLTYLDNVAAKMGPESSDIRPLIRMIKDSRVGHILRGLGYSFVAFSSGLAATEIRNADLYINYKGSITGFRKHLINTTPLRIILNQFSDKYRYDLHRRRVLSIFRRLSTLNLGDPPYFVFAHILSPHAPFVFDKDGNPINSKGPFSINDGNNVDQAARDRYIKGYRDQLVFINNRIRQVVDNILARSQDPPIILLLSDHGPRAYFNWDSIDATYLTESLSVLNALYLPDGNYRDFYPSISSINTMIAIINRITGMNSSFLEDRSYYSTGKRPYDFTNYDPHTYSKSIYSFGQTDIGYQFREHE